MKFSKIFLPLIIALFITSNLFADNVEFRLKSYLDYADRLIDDEKYDKALDKCQEVLRNVTIDSDSSMYARAQMLTGYCYYFLSDRFSPRENLNLALASFKETLKVYTQSQYEWDHLISTQWIAYTYGRLARCEKTEEYLHKANEMQYKTLEFDISKRSEVGTANIKRSIAYNYMNLSTIREREAHVDSAISFLREVVETYKNYPGTERFYYDEMSALASCMLTKSTVDEKKKYLDLSMQLLQPSLEYFDSDENHPHSYAYSRAVLGYYHQYMADVSDTLQNLNFALGFLKNALDVYLKTDNLSMQSMRYHSLASVHLSMAEVADTLENLEIALEYAQKSNEFEDLKEFPQDYSGLLDTFGEIYTRMALVENPEENFKLAYDYFEQACEYITEEEYPIYYAVAQKHWGVYYQYKARLYDKEENLKKSIDYYKKAMKIFTKKKYPIDYQLIDDLLQKAKQSLKS